VRFCVKSKRGYKGKMGALVVALRLSILIQIRTTGQQGRQERKGQNLKSNLFSLACEFRAKLAFLFFSLNINTTAV